MRLLIISMFLSFEVFGQKDSTKVDSMDLKVISMKELRIYLDRINLTAQKQFSVAEMNKYQELLKIIQSVYIEADRKRKK